MLHYCSVADVKTILTAATRYDEAIANAREATTEDFNRFMRRELAFAAGVVETFNSQEAANGFNLWLKKKAIDPASLQVWHSRTSEFDDPDALLDPGLYTLDASAGKIEIVGTMRSGIRTIKIKYDGGYKAIGATDTMACPANIKQAAIDQTVFVFRRSTGLNQNQSADADRKGQIKQKPLVDGLLSEVAGALAPYRRSLGR